jgi:IS30 family transposase
MRLFGRKKDGSGIMSSLIGKFRVFGKRGVEAKPLKEMKVSRKRYGRDELKLIQDLIEQGLSNKEIASRLGRSEAGIRNLRYRRGLIRKAEGEVKVLFKRRDELRSEVEALNKWREALAQDLDKLKLERDKLELIINVDRKLLHNTLAQALTNLKMQRPELFTLSGQEQIAMLVTMLLKSL